MDINIHLTVEEANMLTVLLAASGGYADVVAEKVRLAKEKYDRDIRLKEAASPCHEACQG